MEEFGLWDTGEWELFEWDYIAYFGERVVSEGWVWVDSEDL